MALATAFLEMLDPDIQRFVSEMSAAWARHPDLRTVPPPEARRIAEAVRAPWTRGGPRIASITEHVVDGVRVRCYDPDPDVTKPALIYLHGGGWTLFSLNTHDRIMREYAGRAGVMVVGVDYALAPEAKYPLALEQVVRMARWLSKGSAERAIAIGGDSAGANLAVATCLRLRDEGEPQLIRAMVLNYGVFARQSSPEAERRFGGSGNMLTAEEMESFWRNYLRDERDAENPNVCPLLANLERMPRAFLVVPECDLLAEQSVEMADRLRAARVPVEMKIYPGAVHSFLEAVSIAPLAERAFADSADWLRGSLF